MSKDEIVITLNVIKYKNLRLGECWSVKHILPKSKINSLHELETYVKSMRLVDHHTEKSNYPIEYTVPELTYYVSNHCIFNSYSGPIPDFSGLKPPPLIRYYKCYTINLK